VDLSNFGYRGLHLLFDCYIRKMQGTRATFRLNLFDYLKKIVGLCWEIVHRDVEAVVSQA
jgi:hypothetical protein